MSENGFIGPEAIIISSSSNEDMWIVRTWMVEKNGKFIEVYE